MAQGFTQVEGRDYTETFWEPPAGPDGREQLGALWHGRGDRFSAVAHEGGKQLMCRLSLYGLKQSSRNWNKEIDQWVRAYGFEPNPADSCI